MYIFYYYSKWWCKYRIICQIFKNYCLIIPIKLNLQSLFEGKMLNDAPVILNLIQDLAGKGYSAGR